MTTMHNILNLASNGKKIMKKKENTILVRTDALDFANNKSFVYNTTEIVWLMQMTMEKPINYLIKT